MSESGLYPVQTWLWSELDDLGIDGVIYSRHILDLLISSKHTVDFRLAEKEQNIFSKINPGSKRRKHKYTKRSSSFSACEEILWKKENAVACLLSAADAKTNSEDTVNTIQQVIDELYTKLAGLHLTSDGRKANSDGDYPVTDHNDNKLELADAPKDAPTKSKENYEDAFPTLDGNSASPVFDNLANSVWIKSTQINEDKSGCDSDNAQRPNSPRVSKNNDSAKKKEESFMRRERAKCTSAPDLNNDVFEKPATAVRRPKKLTTYPPYAKSGSRRLPRKRRPNSDTFDRIADADDGTRRRGRFVRKCPNERSRLPVRVRKNEETGKDGIKKSPNKRAGQFPQVVERYQNNTGKRAWKRDASGVKSSNGKGNQSATHDRPSRWGQCVHLPSWMETTIADCSSYMWFSAESAENQPEGFNEAPNEDPKSLQEMAFSSNWYRDAETGLLTFQPSQATLRSSSSSSGSLASSSSSEVDDLLQEVILDGEPAASESWMWCPSPSLWEEDQVSPVSRLQSVYKRELMSLDSAQADVEDISGRIWEEYKTIFQDLQEMPGGSDSEKTSSSDTEDDEVEKLAQSAWARAGSQPEKADEPQLAFLPISVSESAGLDLENVTLSHLTWSSFDDQTSSGSSKTKILAASGADLTEAAASRDAAYQSDIWKYPQTTDVWSAGDDSPPSEKEQHESREEVARLLESGTFGLLCDGYAAKKSAWGLTPAKSLSSEIWGGGDMPAVKKENARDDMSEQRLMNHLVDAMFSDLSFELMFAPHWNEDETALPEKRGLWCDSIPKSTSLDDDDYQTLSFDLQTFFFQSPIENLHFLHSDNLQPQWNISDLFSDKDLAGLSPLTRLDRLFESLTSVDRDRSLDFGHRHALEGGQDRSHKKTVLDSITENDAWKTSLRIGNIWQNISGIRPVNVIYSEHKPAAEKLIPSSQTHFRPISTPLGIESVEKATPSYDDIGSLQTDGSEMYTEVASSVEEPDYNTGSIQADDNGQETGCPAESKEEPSFDIHYDKAVQDKSMQTAFETALQHDVTTCQQLCARPPKASSR